MLLPSFYQIKKKYYILCLYTYTHFYYKKNQTNLSLSATICLIKLFSNHGKLYLLCDFNSCIWLCILAMIDLIFIIYLPFSCVYLTDFFSSLDIFQLNS